MTKGTNLEQGSAEGSRNYQAARDMYINNGISYSEARQLFCDLLEASSPKIEEFITKFLNKLMEESPDTSFSFINPDFLYIMAEAQKSYVRCNDENLEHMLLDLITERSKCGQRSRLQLVLNEAIITSGKLMSSDFCFLALMLMLTSLSAPNISNSKEFANYIEKFVAPYVKFIKKDDDIFYRHLESTGCGSITNENLAEMSLEKIMVKFFPVLFSELSDKNFNFLKVKEKCISMHPIMRDLFDLWYQSPAKHFRIYPVGIAIATTFIKTLNPDFPNLSLWITD